MALARRNQRTKKAKLPPMRYSLTTEIRYVRTLKKYVRSFRDSVKKHLISIVPSLVNSAAPLKQDADDWMDQLNKALARIVSDMTNPARIAESELAAIGAETDEFNLKSWKKLIRTAYGVNPTGIDQKRYDKLLKNWADDNAALIKDIPQKATNQIREDTIEALQSGRSIDQLADIIQERIDVSDSRAEFIARDQIAKLNGDLTKERQSEAGVEKYRWKTVLDERVRDTHKDCDDEIFSWDAMRSDRGVPKPDGNDPGGDFQCRCYAEPILPELMRFNLTLQTEDEAA